MDQNIDSSKLPQVIVNPAIPVDKPGKVLQHDIFGTFSFFSNDQFNAGDSAKDILYDKIYFKQELQNNLSTQNYLIQKYLSGKPVISGQSATATVKKIEPIARVFDKEYSIGNLVIGILLLCFILLAWLKYNFTKYLNQISHSIISYSESVKLFHDHNALADRVYFVLNIIFVLTGGLLFYHIMFHLGINVSGLFYINYLIACSFIAFILLYRIIVTKISGYILQQRSSFDEFNHSNLLYFKACGIALLPLTAILSFVNDFYAHVLIIISILILVTFYFSSIFRGTRIMLQKGVLLFYWILYLCTIEFIPLLLLIQYIRNVIMKV